MICMCLCGALRCTAQPHTPPHTTATVPAALAPLTELLASSVKYEFDQARPAERRPKFVIVTSRDQPRPRNCGPQSRVSHVSSGETSVLPVPANATRQSTNSRAATASEHGHAMNDAQNILGTNSNCLHACMPYQWLQGAVLPHCPHPPPRGVCL